MKARVFRIFKDNKHKVNYTYVSPAKNHDDVESVGNGAICTPMMEIRLHKEDNTLEQEAICTFAPPDVVKEYTGFDIFNENYIYSFEGKVLDIEFEWVEGVYPYGKLYDGNAVWLERYNSDVRLPFRDDYVLSDKLRFPKVSIIKDVFEEDWL